MTKFILLPTIWLVLTISSLSTAKPVGPGSIATPSQLDSTDDRLNTIENVHIHPKQIGDRLTDSFNNFLCAILTHPGEVVLVLFVSIVLPIAFWLLGACRMPALVGLSRNVQSKMATKIQKSRIRTIN